MNDDCANRWWEVVDDDRLIYIIDFIVKGPDPIHDVFKYLEFRFDRIRLDECHLTVRRTDKINGNLRYCDIWKKV